MQLFGRKQETKKEEVHPDTLLIRYVMRKIGAKTDDEVEKKLNSFRVSMAADEQRRLHDEERVREQAEQGKQNLWKDRQLCLKHLPRLQVHYCPTGIHSKTRPEFLTIGEDLTIACTECGKVIDVSDAVLNLAVKLETAGANIDKALADETTYLRGTTIGSCIIKVPHNNIYNGQYCTTVIEVVVKGCRVLGERAPVRH